MRMIVKPVKRLEGIIKVQGDKSISHRSIIVGSISEGITRISNFLSSEDCLKTVEAFVKMGVTIRVENDYVEIQGKGSAGLSEPDDVLDMGNSGTSARLLSGVLSAQPFFSVMSGDRSLRARPMRRVVEPLRAMGASIWGRGHGEYLPMAIRGNELTGISWDMSIASAQVKSAILLAGMYAKGATVVKETVPARDHTERMLKYFGVSIRKEGNKIIIDGGSIPEGKDITIPGDISSAAFFITGAAIIDGSELLIKDVGLNPTRTGFIDVLRKMGAHIEVFNVKESGSEPYGDILVRSATLRGIEIGGEMIPRLIDEIPILCVAAAMANGETIIKDAAELRVKESDRIGVMAECLTLLGVDVETFHDGMRIKGKGILNGNSINSQGDHRIAMSMVIAGLMAKGKTIIKDTECINTSFPRFNDTLQDIVVED